MRYNYLNNFSLIDNPKTIHIKISAKGSIPKNLINEVTRIAVEP